MRSMFSFATTYNQPLNSWDVNSVVDMSQMFRNAENFNQPLNAWDVSAVANMTSMFEDAILFNQPVNSWDVSSVTLMESMFEAAETFNQPINDWNVASVTLFDAMFKDAIVFGQPLDNWDTGEALTMPEMFYGASAFNQNIDSWNVSFVTTMESMFREAILYNQNMDSWNVASVATMESMFQGATSFNGIIDSWNVRGVLTMEDMFSGATQFNQTLNNWRVFNVENMNSMFSGASSYNQSMNQWDLGSVSMLAMLENATVFDQYLGDWDISNVSNMQDMLDNTALIRENYDNTLIAWSEQILTSGIILGAQGLPYCDALEERQSMIDTYGWTILGDVLDCPIPECTQLISPLNGAVDVPVNTNLTWETTLFARGYRLTVGTTSGGNDIVNNETINNATSYEFLADFTGGETVFVTIVPFNDEGDAVGCTEEIFTISNTPATVPDCTTLSTPLNNDTDVAIGVDLSWSPIANADGYRLTVGTSAGASDILNNEDVSNVTSYDLPSDLPEDTVIFVTIIPYNDEGDAAGCTEESFTTEIIPTPPSCTTLTGPLNGTTGVPIDTNISWDTVDGATGYLVIVGITQNGIEVANNVDVGNVTTYDFPSDLIEDRTHYITIIPYNDVGDAASCTEESFRTGSSTLNDPPACTSLLTPSNGTTDVALDSDLSWTLAGNTDGYRLTVGTTTGGNDILDSFDVGNVTTYDLPADLPEGTEIFVTITPYNSNGDAVACIEKSFITETIPTIPECTILTTPSAGETNVAIATDLTWNLITNANGYRLIVGTITGGNDILDNFDVGNVTTYDLPADLPEATEIFVTIIPYNGVGDATSCNEESFFTETILTIPECSTLTTPSAGTTDVSIAIDLTWNAVANADGYRLTIGTTTGGNDILNNVDVGNVLTYNPPADFTGNTEIFVTVVPYNVVGEAIGCAEESFTTEIPQPGCSNLITPVFDAMNVPVDTDLTWNAASNAVRYTIAIGTATGLDDVLGTTDVGNATTFNPPVNLPENTRVFVTIYSFNSDGESIVCGDDQFTTGMVSLEIPDCTTLSSPINGAVGVNTATDISWEATTNADGYRLTVGTSPGGNDIVDNFDTGNTLTFDFSGPFEEGVTVYVNITPYNTDGDAINCIEESFTIAQLIPEVPLCTSLVSPLNGTANVAVDTSISWDEISNADGYRISIGTTSGGNDILNDEDVGILTTYQLTDELPFGQQIFVNITPYNGEGDAENCEEQSFATIVEPEIESLNGLSPDGDGINEFWRIEGIENYPNNTVVIYNRWGDMVFKTESYDNNANVFNGEANQLSGFGASQLPEGTYFFNIIINETTNLKQTKGYLVLKR